MASDSWACEAQAALVGEATDAEVIDLEDWRDDQRSGKFRDSEAKLQ